MAKRYTDEFRRDAMHIATTSDLTRPQVSSDLGVGLSTPNRWAQKHQHDDLMSIAHMKALRKRTPAFAKKSGFCARRGKC